jgi:hypothetical protein
VSRDTVPGPGDVPLYSDGVPKSRGRQPRRPPKARAASGDPRRREAEAAIDDVAGPAAAALNRVLGGDLSDPVTLAEMPARFLDLAVAPYAAAGSLPAGRCVDDCLVLAHACAQFGMEAEARIAELTVTDSVTGSRAVNGSLEPRWEDGMFHGHTVTWLPAHGCLVDPTAEQFEGIDDYGEGAVIAVAGRSADDAPGVIRVRAERGYLRLAYVLGTREASAAVLDHPRVREEGDGYLRRGTNVASGVLARLARRRPARETAMIPYPRMAALADAIRDLDTREGDDGRVYFRQRGPGHHAAMRLDEIPLPAGVPGSQPVA